MMQCRTAGASILACRSMHGIKSTETETLNKMMGSKRGKNLKKTKNAKRHFKTS